MIVCGLERTPPPAWWANGGVDTVGYKGFTSTSPTGSYKTEF